MSKSSMIQRVARRYIKADARGEMQWGVHQIEYALDKLKEVVDSWEARGASGDAEADASVVDTYPAAVTLVRAMKSIKRLMAPGFAQLKYTRVAGMMNSKMDAINEVREAVDVVEEKLGELSGAIEEMRDTARQAKWALDGEPFIGQIDAYLAPHIEAWGENEHQPGSIASLRAMLDDAEQAALENPEGEADDS